MQNAQMPELDGGGDSSSAAPVKTTPSSSTANAPMQQAMPAQITAKQIALATALRAQGFNPAAATAQASVSNTSGLQKYGGGLEDYALNTGDGTTQWGKRTSGGAIITSGMDAISGLNPKGVRDLLGFTQDLILPDTSGNESSNQQVNPALLAALNDKGYDVAEFGTPGFTHRVLRQRSDGQLLNNTLGSTSTNDTPFWMAASLVPSVVLPAAGVSAAGTAAAGAGISIADSVTSGASFGDALKHAVISAGANYAGAQIGGAAGNAAAPVVGTGAGQTAISQLISSLVKGGLTGQSVDPRQLLIAALINGAKSGFNSSSTPKG